MIEFYCFPTRRISTDRKVGTAHQRENQLSQFGWQCPPYILLSLLPTHHSPLPISRLERKMFGEVAILALEIQNCSLKPKD
jgi:hypothetical protein